MRCQLDKSGLVTVLALKNGTPGESRTHDTRFRKSSRNFECFFDFLASEVLLAVPQESDSQHTLTLTPTHLNIASMYTVWSNPSSHTQTARVK